ncbi:MAG: peptide chain release factor N(5)-glutamine methyltransferase [Delftia sp.]|nr:peptide chain release factor N(5)-glutamine methyltransferase [Delftia sp.]
MTHAQAHKHTIATTLARAATQLQATDAPRLEAGLLLAHVLGISRAGLYTYPERPLPEQQLTAYQALLNRRALGEPLPYLSGHIEFYGLDIAVNQHVLIPRPETETLVDLALARHPPPASRLSSLADVGTGSGCIAIALAVHAPHARIYALDLSPDALAVARANAQRHKVAQRITFIQSDLLAALPEPVDLIVSNPPYIAAGEWAALPREVREHEPQLALDGGPDGLDVIRELLEQARDNVRPGGALLVEIGAGQGAAATRLARQIFSTASVSLQADLAGRDRVLCVQTAMDQGDYS